MSPTGIPIDVDVLRDEIQKTYTEVSTDQDQQFIFPTRRTWAQDLGYPEPEQDPKAPRRASQASPTRSRSVRSSRARPCSTSAAAPAPTS